MKWLLFIILREKATGCGEWEVFFVRIPGTVREKDPLARRAMRLRAFGTSDFPRVGRSFLMPR